MLILLSVSITKCWASTTELAAVNEATNEGGWYDDTNTGNSEVSFLRIEDYELI